MSNNSNINKIKNDIMMQIDDLIASQTKQLNALKTILHIQLTTLEHNLEENLEHQSEKALYGQQDDLLQNANYSTISFSSSNSNFPIHSNALAPNNALPTPPNYPNHYAQIGQGMQVSFAKGCR